MPRKIVEHFDSLLNLPFVISSKFNGDDGVDIVLNNCGDNSTFLITTTEDYPRGDSFYWCEATQESGALSGTLDAIATSLHRKYAIAASGGGAGAAAAAVNAASSAILSAARIPDVPPQMGGHASSSGSMGRNDSADNGEFEIPPLGDGLLRDISLAEQNGHRVEIERIAIGVKLSFQFFVAHIIKDGLTSRAWGFKHLSPFRIMLKFERPEGFQSSKMPEIAVTQDGEQCRFGQQLRTIMQLYLKENWDVGKGFVPPHVDQAAAAALHENNSAPSSSSSSKGGGAPSPLAAGMSNEALLQRFIKKLSPLKHAAFVQLCEMGFPEDMAAAASFWCDDVHVALDRCTGATKHDKEPLDVRAIVAMHGGPEGMFGEGGSGGSARLLADASKRADTLQQTSTAAWFSSLKSGKGSNDSKDELDVAKIVVFDPRHDGAVAHLVKYAMHRTRTAHTYCVICDRKHLLAAGASAMLKPCVCERQLCVFSFQQMGVGKDSADSVAAGGGTVDLLLLAFRLCVSSPRGEQILTSDLSKARAYPSVADPDTGRLVFDPAKPDVAALRRIVGQLPSSRQLIGVESIDALSRQLANKDRMLFPLLQWVISSNRSMLVKLDQATRPKMWSDVPMTFMIMQDAPEKAETFNKLREKHGSRFAWHGSAAPNLHSVLRNGLVVASNTTLMSAGAACGVGVYNAHQGAMSLGYAGGAPGGASGKTKEQEGEQYLDGKNGSENITTMYVTEIIKSPHAKDHGWGFVVDNADHIAVRFVVVITTTEGYTQVSNTDFQKEETQKAVRALCAQFMS